MRKNSIFFLGIMVFFTSCISTKKYSTFVRPKVSRDLVEKTVPSLDYLEVKTENLTKQDSLIALKKIKSLFIPAIVFWQWENTIRCDIDPVVPANMMCSALADYGNSMNLKDKLNGQLLEISINQVPARFIYTYKGTVAIFLVAYVTKQLEAIYPAKQELLVTYRLLKEGAEIKKGSVTLENTDQPIKNTKKSTKAFTWSYLDQYENYIRKLSKDLLDKILKEI